MNKQRHEDYLNHMIQAIDDALSYIDGLELADFLEDKRTQQACIMNVLIIGEAATKLMNEYPNFVTQHPQIEWRSMRGIALHTAILTSIWKWFGKLCKPPYLICKPKFKPFKINKPIF